jgi:hypothetical protein
MSRGALSTENVLLNLWEAAADTLTPEQLQWFGSLDDFAQMEAMNLSATLSTLANLAGNVDEVDRPGREEFSKILYSTSYQIETIASLIDIASNAKDRLRDPEGYEALRKAKPEA